MAAALHQPLPWRVPGFAAILNPRAIEDAPTPEQGVQLIREQHPGAWRALFEREMPAIYRYAYARLGDRGRAEDATAEVFENAWRSSPALEDRGLPARAWLFGIARNVVNSHRRWNFRRPAEVSLEAFDGSGGDPAQSAERLDLLQAVATLEPAHSEVISLRFLHDLSLEETAGVLGVTIDAVKGRQARALLALRETMMPGTGVVAQSRRRERS